ncbi:MAG: hypothetical protein DCO96_15075 [Fluviicola sp. XM-24bin1]|nr:MAG: hypothetical protein DCO96_15075 [Fluviicola sp. XM-24bin1]
MESFVRRLKYYGIGFGLGLVFVFFFFRNRGCTWTPSNRVKNTILSRMIVVSDETQAKMDEKGITKKDIVQVLNDGNIDFDASDKSRKNKKYLIEKDGVKYVFTLPYESCISEAFISNSVKKVSGTKEGKGAFIHFPNDKNLVFTDSTSFLACQQDQLGVIGDRQIWRKIQKNGVLDFEKTNLKTGSKPEHYIEFVWDKDTIGTKIVWYKEKLNITSFHSDYLEPCK